MNIPQHPSVPSASPIKTRTTCAAWKEFKHICNVLDAKRGDRWFAYLHIDKVGFLVKRNPYQMHPHAQTTQHDMSLPYTMIIVVGDRIYHTFDESLEMLFQQGSRRIHNLTQQCHKTTPQLILISGWHKQQPLSNLDCYATIASILDEECQVHIPEVIVHRVTHYTNYHPL